MFPPSSSSSSSLDSGSNSNLRSSSEEDLELGTREDINQIPYKLNDEPILESSPFLEEESRTALLGQARSWRTDGQNNDSRNSWAQVIELILQVCSINPS